MKWMIASDLHGSYYYAQQLQQAFEREQADRLLFLGDLLYHGPRNDLPQGYAPKEVIAQLSGVKDKVFCVRGNCEAEVDQMVLPFPVLADYCLLEQKGRVIFATHGHHYNLENPPLLQPGDVLLHGHTHIPAKDNSLGFWYLNPGSVSIPKENSPHSYMTLEDGQFLWKDLDGAVYDSLAL
jgi:putative phosphoesterase